MIPEIRTSRTVAIVLSVSAVLSFAVAVFGAGKLEQAFGSETGALVILFVWCTLGAAAAITGLVDAFIRPEGERLELATRIGATVFSVLALVVVTGIIVGATGAIELGDPS